MKIIAVTTIVENSGQSVHSEYEICSSGTLRTPARFVTFGNEEMYENFTHYKNVRVFGVLWFRVPFKHTSVSLGVIKEWTKTGPVFYQPDLYTKKAMEMFDVKEHQVTREMRTHLKTMLYSRSYGKVGPLKDFVKP